MLVGQLLRVFCEKKNPLTLSGGTWGDPQRYPSACPDSEIATLTETYIVQLAIMTSHIRWVSGLYAVSR